MSVETLGADVLAGLPDGPPDCLYVDVGAFLDKGDRDAPTPEVLRRDDEHHLFYRRAVNYLYGDPESGKSWVAFTAAAEELCRATGTALIIDADHNGVRAVVQRLLLLGVPEHVLRDVSRFRYVEPDDSVHLVAVVEDAAEWTPGVAVIDSVGEVLPLLNLSSNDADDFTKGNRRVMRPLADAGWCVIAIDHLAKGRDSRNYGAAGTAAKRRAVDGLSARVTSVQPFAPGLGGVCALSIHKDRHGGVREHAPRGVRGLTPCGTYYLNAEVGGRSMWSISEPRDTDVVGDADDRAEADADRLAELDPPPVSQRDVQERMSWGGTRAIEALRAFRSRSAPGAPGSTDGANAPRSAPGGTGAREHGPHVAPDLHEHPSGVLPEHRGAEEQS